MAYFFKMLFGKGVDKKYFFLAKIGATVGAVVLMS